ncbi:MAG: AAA family ATPase [Pseudomonadota bacterium]|nr:AAA family ATPase [Pseudomonadota bacterium]
MPYIQVIKSYPPRRWGIFGFKESGKTAFLAAMNGPILLIDAEGRSARELSMLDTEVFALSSNPMDHHDPLRIYQILRQNGAGPAKTVAVDSLTSIFSPINAESMQNAKTAKNKASVWVDKAGFFRLIQDAVSGCGVDAAFIWHRENNMNAKGEKDSHPTISDPDLEKLKRSLNAIIGLYKHNNGSRSAKVVWSRNGPSGMAFKDEEGYWKGVPEKIDAAINGYQFNQAN